MATNGDSGYALGRLVLDYLRALMWPAVVIVLVLLYEEDVRTILAEREVDLFGLRIGRQVEDIQDKTQQEIADLRALLEQQRAAAGGDTEIASDIETKLDNLERNLSREVAQVQAAQQQATAPAAMPDMPAGGRAERAAAAERRGFEALLRRDLDAALAAFDEAHAAWPEYHNVAEVRGLLQEREAALRSGGESAWLQLYRTVLTQFSWGLPAELRPEFRASTAKAY